MKKSFMEKQINKNFMLTLILVAMLLFFGTAGRGAGMCIEFRNGRNVK